MTFGEFLIRAAAVLILPAIAAHWWCNKLFGRLYMNRSNILHPNSKASKYWSRTYVVFLIIELALIAMAFVGNRLPSPDNLPSAPAHEFGTPKTPSLTAQIAQDGKLVTVRIYANIRTAGNTSASIVRVASPGEKFVLLNQANGWLQVATIGADKPIGWIAATLIDPD
jgi:hypothetical protein